MTAGLAAGCSTPTPEALTSKVALSAFKPIASSCKDTKATREQIAAHNSAYDTLKTGKKTVYKPHSCKPKKLQPKTS
jgi:hypothetical protein